MEFSVIDSAPSAEALRKRLKPEQLERYGDQFIPKFVYDAIRKLKRFDTMVVSNTWLGVDGFAS